MYTYMHTHTHTDNHTYIYIMNNAAPARPPFQSAYNKHSNNLDPGGHEDTTPRRF
jgi:hypothetical protein